MISFKRTKKRSYRNPTEKYFFYGLAGVFVLLTVLMLTAFSGKSSLKLQLDEAREMMAASISTDMRQALGSYENIDRKSADLQNDILPTMQQHMHSAYTMNRVLTETFGEEYSMIDAELYESFESIMKHFDNLLAAGQSTDPAKEELVACMDGMKTALNNRFNDEGGLLPKTASK